MAVRLVLSLIFTSGTFELIENAGIKALKHSTNKGYGASLKTGIKNSAYNTIVITDADGTYPNDRIPELVKTFEDENLDVVVVALVNKNVKIPLIGRLLNGVLLNLRVFCQA